MPRPKSGNPPWEAIAVKLPPSLMDQVRLYTDQNSKVSISQLVREGLEMRLGMTQPASNNQDITVIPQRATGLLERLAVTLSHAAEELRSACQDVTETQEYNGNALGEARDDIVADRDESALDALVADASPAEVATLLADTTNPVLDAIEEGLVAPVAAPVGAMPSYDTTKYVLGKLCPGKHEYADTGKSLLRLPKRQCEACKREDTRQRRQRQRQG